MKTRLVVLAMAGALLTAGLAQAHPDSEVQGFLDQAYATALARVETCGVDLAAHPVTVRAYIDDDRRLRRVKVIESTGSVAADRAIEAALVGTPLDHVPPQMIAARITLSLGRVGASGAGLPIAAPPQ